MHETQGSAHRLVSSTFFVQKVHSERVTKNDRSLHVKAHTHLNYPRVTMSSLERILERANHRTAHLPPMPSFSTTGVPPAPTTGFGASAGSAPSPAASITTKASVPTSFFTKHKYLLLILLLVLLVLVCIVGILIIVKARKRSPMDPINPNTLPSLPNGGRPNQPTQPRPTDNNPEPAAPPSAPAAPSSGPQTQEASPAPVSRLRQRIRRLVYDDPAPRQAPPRTEPAPLPVVSGSVSAQQADELAALQQAQRAHREAEHETDHIPSSQAPEEAPQQAQLPTDTAPQAAVPEAAPHAAEEPEPVSVEPTQRSANLTAMLQQMQTHTSEDVEHVAEESMTANTPSVVPLHVVEEENDGAQEIAASGGEEGAETGVEETKSESAAPSSPARPPTPVIPASEVTPVKIPAALTTTQEEDAATATATATTATATPWSFQAGVARSHEEAPAVMPGSQAQQDMDAAAQARVEATETAPDGAQRIV